MSEVKRSAESLEASDNLRQRIDTLEARSEALEKERDALKAENTTLRTLVAVQPTPCIYCGLTEMAKCASGFPGCARADDLICGEDEAFRAVVVERNALKVEVARLKAKPDEVLVLSKDGVPAELTRLLAEVARLSAACGQMREALHSARELLHSSEWPSVCKAIDAALSDTAGTGWIDATGAVERVVGMQIPTDAVPDDWAGATVKIVRVRK